MKSKLDYRLVSTWGGAASKRHGNEASDKEIFVTLLGGHLCPKSRFYDQILP